MKQNSAAASNAAFDAVGSAHVSSRPQAVGIALAVGLIRLYQLTISPLFPGACRFVPSCSAYASEAVREHGVGRGFWLAAKRLARCHPLCQGGHDPVPPAGTFAKVTAAHRRAKAGVWGGAPRK